MGPSGSANPQSNVSGYKRVSTSNYTPEMQQLFSQLLGKIGGGAGKGADYLSRLAGGDEDIFAQMEAPAQRGFQKTLGQIGSRFSQVGAQDSSAFQNAVAGAGAELNENLASKRNDYQLRAIESLLNNSQQLLGQRPYENSLVQKQQRGGTDFGDILSKVLPSLLKLL